MSRFIRDYKLSFIFSDGTEVMFKPPTKIVFNADKSVFGGLNTMNIQVFNLNRTNRDRIVKRKIDNDIVIKVKLQAGYIGNLSTIYIGTVFEANTSRQGADLITDIQCMDGGEAFYGSFTSKTVKAGADINREIIADMDGVEIGEVKPKVLTRPAVLEGNPIEIIRDNLDPNDQFFIDNEKCYIIEKTKTVSPETVIVDASTGLINVPSIDSVEVTFDTVMNPKIRTGGLVKITSSLDKRLKGAEYKVRTINYNGNTDGQEWTQTVTCVPKDFL